MTVAIVLFAAYKKISLSIKKNSMWKFLILIGVFETLAYFSISIGYSMTTKTSVVALLSGAFSLPTIILARLFLKEKVTALQTLGSIIIIVGIMLLPLL
jgi:drug/metabolite transporter (DMT)-like permease